MNYKILILSFFILLSCKKNSLAEKPSIDEMTKLKNYEIKRTRVNDTIDKIFGENKFQYISGNFNSKTQKKDGWWKISNKKSNEFVEIEYLDIKPENFNQLKFFVNGKLVNNISCFYELRKQSDNIIFKAYFPIVKNKKQFANLQILVFDTLTKKIIREEKKIELQKKGNLYSTTLPKYLNSTIFGNITEFTVTELKNENGKLEVQTIYFME